MPTLSAELQKIKRAPPDPPDAGITDSPTAEMKLTCQSQEKSDDDELVLVSGIPTVNV